MPIKYDVVAITGHYKKDGEDKPVRRKVGVVIEKNGNFYLKMESMVNVNDEGNVVNFFSLYEPRRNNQQQAPQQQAPSQPDFDDDIPF